MASTVIVPLGKHSVTRMMFSSSNLVHCQKGNLQHTCHGHRKATGYGELIVGHIVDWIQKSQIQPAPQGEWLNQLGVEEII